MPNLPARIPPARGSTSAADGADAPPRGGVAASGGGSFGGTGLPARTRRLLTTLGVLVFAALLLEPAVVGGRVFFERDVHGVWMAQSEALYRSVTARSWPPWDDTVGFGFPQVANPNQQSYYPPGWLPLLMPPWYAYTLIVFVHVALAVGGLYRLTRHYGLSSGAALTAGALYGASGPLLSLVNVWHHLAGAAILPWLVLATERALERPGRRPTIAWGGVAALAVLAGSPDMCVLGAVIVVSRLSVALWTSRTTDGGRARRGAVLLVMAGAAVAALGLSAAQWMPTLEAVWNAPRASRELANRAVWAVDPLALAQLFLPLSFTGLPRFAPQAAVDHADLWQGFVRSVYLGLAAGGLALVGLGSRRRFERSFWAGVSLVCLLYSLGRLTPVFAAFSAIPPLSMLRYPSKLTIGVSLGFAILSGLGVERLQENVGKPHRLLLGWLAVLGAVATWLLAAPGAFGHAGTGVLADSRNDLAAAAGASLVAALIVVVGRPRAGPGVASVACAAVCVAELAAANHKLNPTTEPDFFRYRPEILDVVGTSPLTRLYVWDYAIRIPSRPRPTDPLLGTFMEPADPKARALALQMYLYPPTAGRWGLSGSYDQDLLGLFPSPLFWATYGLRWVEGTPAFVAALRNGGVDYVVSLHESGLEGLREVRTLRGLYTRPIHVFSVPDALPRTYVVGRARRASTEKGLAALFDPNWDPRSEVLIGGGPEVSGSRSFTGWSRITKYEPGRVQLEVGLSEPGYVVLLDAWAPGWVATTGGRTLAVETANGIFRAVHLSPGTHSLEMRYRPGSALAGLVVSGLTLAVLATLSLPLVRSTPGISTD